MNKRDSIGQKRDGDKHKTETDCWSSHSHLASVSQVTWRAS